MRRTTLLVTTLAVMSAIAGVAPTAGAQKPPTAGEERGGPEQPPRDPFARLLFPPELIMQHQSELGLTDAQRSTLMTAMQQAQGKFVETQFKLAGEGEKLARLLQASSIDESQALEQVDRVLSAERELKRAQVGLLVRLKNALTAQQQAKLMQLRQKE